MLCYSIHYNDFLVTSPIVINVPTRGSLAVETMHAVVQWLANLNLKRNMTTMFVNKKHRYMGHRREGGGKVAEGGTTNTGSTLLWIFT